MDVPTFISERAQAASKELARSVLPLFTATDSGTPDRIGSCVLVQVANGRFAATAAHVVDAAEGTPLYAALDGSLVELPRDAFVVREPWDIAVVPLGASDLPGDYLGIDRIKPDDEPNWEQLGLSQYLVLGFPVAASQVWTDYQKKHVRQNVFTLTAMPVRPEVLPDSVNPTIHFGLTFDRKRVKHRNAQVVAPDPTGVSGGAVCRFAPDLSPNVDLVGIAIEHHGSDRLIVATRIRYLLELMERVQR